MAILVNEQLMLVPVLLLAGCGLLIVAVLGWALVGLVFGPALHLAVLFLFYVALAVDSAVLLASGTVYGAFWQLVLGVGLVVGALAVLGAVVIQVRNSTGSWPDWVPMVALVLALPATMVGLLQLVSPTGSLLPGSSNCSSTSVYGSHLLVRVKAAGQNARSGPGTSYLIENRFDSGCVLGVDGYCIGEPVSDSVVGLADVRWLRLRYTRSYVSSGSVDELGPDARVTNTEGQCDDFGSQRLGIDGRTEVQPDPSDSDLVLLKSSPVGTPLVGYAVYSPAVGVSTISAIGQSPKTITSDGIAYARLSVKNNRPAKQTDRLVLAISACQAAGVPAGDPQVYEISLDRRKGVDSKFRVSSAIRTRLALAACRIDPSASNSALVKASVSTPG